MGHKDDDSLLYINHDIRNYIGAAISHTQLLTMQHPSLENSPYTSAIVESLNEATELSEKASKLVRNKHGEQELVDSQPDLKTYLLDEAYFSGVDASYEPLRKTYSMEVNVSCAIRKGNYAIRLNLEALKALRHNLISNAHDAGATIVNAQYEMKEYCLVVTLTDNGKGMNQESLDKIILAQHGDGILHGVGTKRYS